MSEAPPKETIDKCDALLVQAVEIFAEEVCQMAAAEPASITPKTIGAMVSRVKADTHWAPRQRFLEAVDGCLSAFEESIWSQARRQYFERYLVRSFVHLFPADSRNPQGKGLLSRRLLPGFFAAVEMMVGKEYFEKCRIACKKIVHARQEEYGGPVPWDELRHEPKAHLVVDDALVVIARYFTDLDKRLDWLTEMVNSHLAPEEDYAFEGKEYAHWQASRIGMKNLLRCLFWTFKVRLAKPDGSAWFDARYGAEAREIMNGVVTALYSDDGNK